MMMGGGSAVAAGYSNTGLGHTLQTERAQAAHNTHFGTVPLVQCVALLAVLMNQFGTPTLGGATLSTEGLRLLFSLDAGTCAVALCSCAMTVGVVTTVITGTETYDRGRGPNHNTGSSSPVVAGHATTRGPLGWYDIASFARWTWGAFPHDCFTWTRYPYAAGNVRCHSFFIDHEHFLWTNVGLYTFGAALVVLYGATFNNVLRCGDTGQEGIRNGSILCKACQRRGVLHHAAEDDDGYGAGDGDDNGDDDEDDGHIRPGAGILLHSTADPSVVCSVASDTNGLSPLRKAAVAAVVSAPRLLTLLCIVAGVTHSASTATTSSCVSVINDVYDLYATDAAANVLLGKCTIVLNVWNALIPFLHGAWGGAQSALGLNSMYDSNGERIVAEELIRDARFGTTHGIGNIIDLVVARSLHFVIDTSVSLISMRRIVGGTVVLQNPQMLLRLERVYDASSVPWMGRVPPALRQFNHCQSCGAKGNLHSEGTAWRVCRRCDMRGV